MPDPAPVMLAQPNAPASVHSIDPVTKLLRYAPVRGPFNVQHDSNPLLLPPVAKIIPGDTYTVSVYTLCQSEAVTIQAVPPPESLTAAEFARLCQIVGSIQHVTRRACLQCRECYVHALTNYEKTRLISTQPKLGKILGIETTTVDRQDLKPGDLLSASGMPIKHP